MRPSIRTRPIWALPAAVALGAAAGLAAAMAGWVIAADDGSSVTTTAAPTTTTVAAPEWFHPAEVPLGPAVLVPEALRVEAGALSLRYRLEPITPAAAGPGEAVDTAVFPDRWTLVTSSGTTTAATDPWTRVVSFPLTGGTTPDQVEQIRVDRYWVRSPIRVVVTVDPAAAPVTEIAPGLSVEVVRTISGSAGSQVVVGILTDEGATVSELAVDGVGGEWVTSSVDQTGTGRWTLSFASPTPPDPLHLAVRGVMWVSIDTALVVDLSEVPRG